ncbi:glycosyltransferase family 39 protein [Methanococcoides burtonii]|uniref:Protein with oligosaccharyl transferase domain n=1 Tax=Methanococcoides burtonii (strain DSM 6242 / NBRC 107633 / OCM 468 / ACE-M) TaxID=259564 RepID=Q12VK5_METBU|nr:glycosyltransferase family 39 protein [Methanococcoides burtonii]ABE52521.1 protein with oligosaccharyl transferase domain [Methanococcoides burtonii DSM 6242]
MVNKSKKPKNKMESEIVPKPQKQTSDENPALQKVLSEKYLTILIAITLLGTILRIYSLATESIWLDEATSVNIASRSLMDIIFGNNDFAHPPLYYSILHFVMMVSQSEFALRLPSAIFGSLSIPLIYLVGKELLDKKTAIIASFLLSVSTFHINYSQEGRSYALMMLLVLLTIYLFINAYNKKSTLHWTITAISASVLVYTHFFGFFVIAAMGLYYLINEFDIKILKFRSFEESKIALIGTLAFIVMSLPMIVWVIKELGYVSGNKTWGMSQEGFFHTILLSFSSYSNLLLYIYAILLIIGILFCMKDFRKSLTLLSIWLFLPLVTGYFLAGSMPFQPRYLLFVLPAYLLLISNGIVSISKIGSLGIDSSNSTTKGKNQKNKTPGNNNTLREIAVIAVILLVVCSISFIPLNNYYTSMSKNDWRSAALALEEITQPGDVITPLPGYMSQPLEYYYNNQTDETIIKGTGYSEADMTKHAKGSKRIWYIVTWDISAANSDGTAIKWLQENASPVGQITGIYVYTYPKIDVNMS